MISERAGSVLNILVNEYIDTATPVASEDIARLSPHKMSPATVRNAMSRLTNEGYISRSHVSAGAVPSDRGYRHYIESMTSPPELPEDIRQEIHHGFSKVGPDMQILSRQCAVILSNLTANMAIVTVPRARAPRLKQVQLVYLEEFLAMLIIVLQESRLLRRLIPLEEPANQGTLNELASTLNESYNDLTHREIELDQAELTPLGARVKRDTVAMLKEAETFSFPEHHVDGMRRLLDQPEFSQANRAKELVELVEERVLLEGVLSETPSDGDVSVYVGEENREESLRPFGVIVCQYGIPHQVSGTICVIGPTRMGYTQAIGGVSFLSSFMSQLMLDFYGGAPADSPFYWQ